MRNIFWIGLLLPCICQAQGNGPVGSFQTTVPDHVYNLILSRPTDRSVTVSVLTNKNLTGRLEYKSSSEFKWVSTADKKLSQGEVGVWEIDGLASDQRFQYRFFFSIEGSKSQVDSGFFQTQRAVGKSFRFLIQADSHLDENCSLPNYLRTLQSMARDSADFLIDLGDTWMTDKYRPDFKMANAQYLAQRYYLSQVTNRSALFLTLGNHDGEAGQSGRKSQSSDMLGWSTQQRKKYYFNPQPNGFYSGNTRPESDLGMPQNYYAWEWGDALFIVLDPFRFSAYNRDPWQRTLGKVQYDWLHDQLQRSRSSFKFVFIHNLVGGVDLKGLGRGGAESSIFYEWGGKNADSSIGFSQHRSGWEMPIHDLLIKYGVNAVFHGHDHFFAKQERDGLIYQLLPQPGAARPASPKVAEEYGYLSGVRMSAAGYLRVQVMGEEAWVEYVTCPTSSPSQVLYRYQIKKKI